MSGCQGPIFSNEGGATTVEISDEAPGVFLSILTPDNSVLHISSSTKRLSVISACQTLTVSTFKYCIIFNNTICVGSAQFWEFMNQSFCKILNLPKGRKRSESYPFQGKTKRNLNIISNFYPKFLKNLRYDVTELSKILFEMWHFLTLFLWFKSTLSSDNESSNPKLEFISWILT